MLQRRSVTREGAHSGGRPTPCPFVWPLGCARQLGSRLRLLHLRQGRRRIAETCFIPFPPSKEEATLNGHHGAVEAVGFSPDGKIVATGSHDEAVKLWDGVRAGSWASLRGHTSMIRSIAYSPHGRTVASGSYDNTIRVWDVATGMERAQLNHNGAVRSLAFARAATLVPSLIAIPVSMALTRCAGRAGARPAARFKGASARYRAASRRLAPDRARRSLRGG
jgi:WD40 repeat protein